MIFYQMNFGWFPEKISNDLDFVILGMHAKKNNPELLRAKELNLILFLIQNLFIIFPKIKLELSLEVVMVKQQLHQ